VLASFVVLSSLWRLRIACGDENIFIVTERLIGGVHGSRLDGIFMLASNLLNRSIIITKTQILSVLLIQVNELMVIKSNKNKKFDRFFLSVWCFQLLFFLNFYGLIGWSVFYKTSKDCICIPAKKLLKLLRYLCCLVMVLIDFTVFLSPASWFLNGVPVLFPAADFLCLLLSFAVSINMPSSCMLWIISQFLAITKARGTWFQCLKGQIFGI